MATTSFFTKILAKRLEGDGANMPDSILDLLDTPFSQFSEEEQRLYKEQLQKNQLEAAFSRLLKIIYSETVKSGRHSWKAMYHMIKDTPIKRCVSFLAEEEIEEEEARVGVFVCHCGINIGSIVDVQQVADYARSLPNVVYSEADLYTCSQDTQERMLLIHFRVVWPVPAGRLCF